MTTLLIACVTDEQDLFREQWLQNQMISDHYSILKRETILTAGKFEKMQGIYLDGNESIYPFFRGNLNIFYADLSAKSSFNFKTKIGGMDSQKVWLIGDPHLENLSIIGQTEDTLSLDWDDYDASGFGPWQWDLRRLSLSFWIMLKEANASLKMQIDVLDALLEGYFRGIRQWQSQKKRIVVDEDLVNHQVLKNLFLKSKAQQAELLLDHTNTDHSAFKLGTLETPLQQGVIKNELRKLDDQNTHWIKSIWFDFQKKFDLTKVDLIDQVQKLGTGVSSYPFHRFYLLTQDQSSLQKEIWMMKEIADRPVIAENETHGVRPFSSPAQRIKMSRFFLESRHDLSIETMIEEMLSFRIVKLSGFEKGLNLQKIKEWMETEGLSPIKELAMLSGLLLAQSHCFSPSLDGWLSMQNGKSIDQVEQGGVLITRDLFEQEENLRLELIDFLNEYESVIFKDLDFMRTLIQVHGPLLGWQP